jgi:hypothetical protein
MNDGNKSTLINTVLLVVVALLGGGIAGFLLAQNEAAPIAYNAPVQIAAPINDVLGIQDVWIVEGFSCPTPNCTRPLLTCPDPLARQIRGWVNSQRAAGRNGESIRGEILQTHGNALNKLPSDSL